MENQNKKERKTKRFQKIFLYIGIFFLIGVVSRIFFSRLLSVDDFILFFTFHKYSSDFLHFIVNYWYLNAHVIGYWWAFIFGIFFVASSLGIKKRNKTSLFLLILFALSLAIYMIYKISMGLDDFHSITELYTFFLILLLVIWTVSSLFKETIKDSYPGKKSSFLLIGFSIILLIVIIFSTFYYFFIFEKRVSNITAQKSIKNLNLIKEGMTKKEIIKFYGLPHVKRLIYRYKDKGFFSIPIINGFFKDDYDISRQLIKKELNININDDVEEKIKDQIGMGKKEEAVLEQYGLPVFTLWSYIKWKGRDTYSVYDVIFKKNRVTKIQNNGRVEGPYLF